MRTTSRLSPSPRDVTCVWCNERFGSIFELLDHVVEFRDHLEDYHQDPAAGRAIDPNPMDRIAETVRSSQITTCR